MLSVDPMRMRAFQVSNKFLEWWWVVQTVSHQKRHPRTAKTVIAAIATVV
jgi:hypothetical protein